LLGTNSSGTFVARTMRLVSGVFSANVQVTYEATSEGAIKWGLLFTPDLSGQYLVTYSWLGVPSNSVLRSDAKTLSTHFGSKSFTLDWNDVPSGFTVQPSLYAYNFSLAI